MYTLIRTIRLLKNKELACWNAYLSANVYGNNLNSTKEKWFRDGCQRIIYQSTDLCNLKITCNIM